MNMKREVSRALFASLLLSGCSCAMNLGHDPSDGGVGLDGRAPVVLRADECGNGLDDDGNGRIDDGCPCGPGETQSCFSGLVASRDVGTCTDGVQTCSAAGVEWGDWGSAPCVGGTSPAAEQCDGMDHDCDGARDEGCPCTSGATRECGADFVLSPCMGGTQTCSASGTWSACEGAIGPMPDVCDGIDNDCDGTADVGCGCVPEPERCRDGRDNDCDGEIDEIECTPDWPPTDAGVPMDAGSLDAGLPPPEDCTTPIVPDFRDRIVWHTALPDAHTYSGLLAGTDDSLIALGLAASDGIPSYTFGGTTVTEPRLGYLSFADGAPGALHAWPPGARMFPWGSAFRAVGWDISGDRLGVAGTFLGSVDIGLGAWMSDPTLYATSFGPRPVADFFAASAAVGTGAVTGGRHFNITGVPAAPDPGSFFPFVEFSGLGVDSAGNVYLTGSFQGAIVIDGNRVDGSPDGPAGWWGAFVVSFSATGTLRWLDVTQNAQGDKLAVDPSGRYVALTRSELVVGPPSSFRTGVLELRDAATGAVLFTHRSMVPLANLGSAIDVDSSGRVFVMGQGGTLLGFATSQNWVASFDRAGALLWSHELIPFVGWRRAVVSNGTEVAIILGEWADVGTDPRRITIGSCARDLPRRESSERDLFLAVLDAGTGEHRWSRVIETPDNSAGLALHPSGDVVVVVHWSIGSRGVVDYGDGPQSTTSHVLRLRGR